MKAVGLLGIAVTVTLLLAAGGCRISQEQPGTTASPTATCRIVPPSPAPPVGDSSGITIVEQGFSAVGAGDSAKVSMGVVLRNQTGKVAYRTLVTLDAVNSAGDTVIGRIHQALRTQVVPMIMPGESVAVGSSGALGESARQGGPIASIATTIQVSRWLEPGDGSTGLGRITAGVVPGSGRKDARGQGVVSYDIASTNCAPMTPRGVSLVFRDSAGTVIGGSLDNPAPLDTCKPGSSTDRQSSLTQSDIPARADLDRTEVTVYCDFDRPPITSATSGVPYN